MMVVLFCAINLAQSHFGGANTVGKCPNIPGVGNVILMIGHTHKHIVDALNSKNPHTKVDLIYRNDTTSTAANTHATTYQLGFEITSYSGSQFVFLEFVSQNNGIGSMNLKKAILTNSLTAVAQVFTLSNFDITNYKAIECGDQKALFSGYGTDPTAELAYAFPGRNQNSLSTQFLSGLSPQKDNGRFCNVTNFDNTIILGSPTLQTDNSLAAFYNNLQCNKEGRNIAALSFTCMGVTATDCTYSDISGANGTTDGTVVTDALQAAAFAADVAAIAAEDLSETADTDAGTADTDATALLAAATAATPQVAVTEATALSAATTAAAASATAAETAAEAVETASAAASAAPDVALTTATETAANASVTAANTAVTDATTVVAAANTAVTAAAGDATVLAAANTALASANTALASAQAAQTAAVSAQTLATAAKNAAIAAANGTVDCSGCDLTFTNCNFEIGTPTAPTTTAEIYAACSGAVPTINNPNDLGCHSTCVWDQVTLPSTTAPTCAKSPSATVGSCVIGLDVTKLNNNGSTTVQNNGSTATAYTGVNTVFSTDVISIPENGDVIFGTSPGSNNTSGWYFFIQTLDANGNIIDTAECGSPSQNVAYTAVDSEDFLGFNVIEFLNDNTLRADDCLTGAAIVEYNDA